MSTHGSLFAYPSPPLPRPRGLLTEQVTPAPDASYLAGKGEAIRRVRSQLDRIAPYVRTALITGEAGTGKEQIARMLHARGPGAEGPFVMWQAMQFAEELTGVERGAALLLEAHGGTLFLTKMEAVPRPQQALLLQLLQQQKLRAQRCDLRIVTSSERDLRTLMTAGQFREDLYRRIATVEIGLIPLRKRPEDIAEIAMMLLRRAGGRGISAEAMVRLEQYSWPGNIIELRDLMERAVGLAGEAMVEVSHLLLPAQREASEPDLQRLQDVVRRHVLEVLTRCSGNKLRASEVLGISRSTLYRMLDACAAGSDPGYPG